jgi:hypothetical protein
MISRSLLGTIVRSLSEAMIAGTGQSPDKEMFVARAKKKADNGGANLGFEAKMFLAADKLRGDMDASEYKHIVLGLIFLKYISDAFEAMRTKLDEDEYAAPISAFMRIDVSHDHFSRRSISTWAKKADAVLRISLARRSSLFSLL